MRQITFIHQALFASYTKANFYIYIKVFRLLFSIWHLHCILEHCTFLIYASHFVVYVVRVSTRYSETLPLKLDLCQLHRNMALPHSTCKWCEFTNWQLQNWLRNWKWTHCWIESPIETQFGLMCLQSVPRTLSPTDLHQQVVLSFRLSV